MRYDHAAAVIPYLGRNNKSSIALSKAIAIDIDEINFVFPSANRNFVTGICREIKKCVTVKMINIVRDFCAKSSFNQFTNILSDNTITDIDIEPDRIVINLIDRTYKVFIASKLLTLLRLVVNGNNTPDKLFDVPDTFVAILPGKL